ncbi:hypothetical protein KAFR_0E02530 [Kazachstania africana CBS 2517]|uniref:Uncharacterized protein n=1 Tax=Kazachstania africana (strain ATCC 22294 / BCRC 22015 / CBS 2517 / CECT 1963 / NBRC 1671 / NRRL Y-8276) TaxID=1071382 RepID=H2AVK6_KAZAF|nr:hypothetical protein KAFR_0E02530 [Kazachstania africana CBS 2517]CCF58406.1 hypothetical protein KAFR_0E02530 [Kazachstania africana CBS 2517]
MTGETPESSIVYEDPIEIPLDDDSDDEQPSQQDHNDLRSSTNTPLAERAATIDGEEDVDGDDDIESNNSVKTVKIDGKDVQLSYGKTMAGTKVPKHLLERRRIGRIKAAEAFAKKLKKIGIEKIENITLPQTGLFQPLNLINQKNYSSDYIRKDDQIFALRERKTLRSSTNANNNNTSTPKAVVDLKTGVMDDEIDLNDPNSTIIIQPGSETMKIGFALDETPLLIPNLVAIPKKDDSKGPSTESKLNTEQSEEFEDLKNELHSTFKERMRYYKRRIQPNSHEQVKSFNRNAQPETILDNNDPARIRWITQNDKVYYGNDALLCPESFFSHRKPFGTCRNGALFNLMGSSYSSVQELLGDVIKLIEFGLNKLLEAKNKDKYKAILVIPDLFEKSHVEEMIRLLLTELPFNAVAIIQESLATCYGAGISTSTCVVNVGASETSVSCIDEGVVLENSLINLNYGGDDITRLFSVLLKMNNFPYQDWNVESIAGWNIAETLKKQIVTLQDADVTVQLSNFMKRVFNEPTEKYEFKTFDEVMLAPLALFAPRIFSYLRNEESKNSTLQYQLPESKDLFTHELNDWRSMTQEACKNNGSYCDISDELQLLTALLEVDSKLEAFQSEATTTLDNKRNMLPLDKAIIQSITDACLSLDPSKMDSFYSNILVVGGSSNIPAFDFMLTDRINIWRPRLLSLSSFPQFYKNLSKEIKDLEMESQSTAKLQAQTGSVVPTTGSSTPLATNAGNDGETMADLNEVSKKLSSNINDLIKTKLQDYISNVESQNSNEHYFPVGVVPPPRDMSAAILSWKGASVLAQIKLVEELFITNLDWDMHGSRILQHKCIFTY